MVRSKHIIFLTALGFIILIAIVTPYEAKVQSASLRAMYVQNIIEAGLFIVGMFAGYGWRMYDENQERDTKHISDKV